MQTNGRGSRRGKFGKLGLFVLGTIVFTASRAWAVPFTGAGQGSFTVTPAAQTLTIQGYTTVGGAIICNGLQTNFEYVDPTGACGAEETEGRGTVDYSCQFEGSADLFYSTGTYTSCAPTASCFDANGLLLVGCPYTQTHNVTATGGTGIAEGSSGSWTYSATGTFTQVELSEDSFLFAGVFSVALQGDFELAEGSVAPAGATLEIPSPGTNVSGISLISGWSCLGGELQVEFSDAGGVIETMTVLQGAERPDTADVCGDTDNGFSATYNWNRLGPGEKTARLIRNGEEVDAHTFFVTAFDTEFVPGASGRCTITDFPTAGTNATFAWEESQQGLVLESVH